jgi:hypothetical protein
MGITVPVTKEAAGKIIHGLQMMCSKRLHPYLQEGIKVLERCRGLQLEPEPRSLLLQISRSSIDRYLTQVRFP